MLSVCQTNSSQRHTGVTEEERCPHWSGLTPPTRLKYDSPSVNQDVSRHTPAMQRSIRTLCAWSVMLGGVCLTRWEHLISPLGAGKYSWQHMLCTMHFHLWIIALRSTHQMTILWVVSWSPLWFLSTCFYSFSLMSLWLVPTSHHIPAWWFFALFLRFGHCSQTYVVPHLIIFVFPFHMVMDPFYLQYFIITVHCNSPHPLLLGYSFSWGIYVCSWLPCGFPSP